MQREAVARYEHIRQNVLKNLVIGVALTSEPLNQEIEEVIVFQKKDDQVLQLCFDFLLNNDIPPDDNS